MNNRIIKGVSWSAIERFSVQIVQFIVSMVLARLLEPEMYGVVAIAMVLVTILQTINETGFATALINKQNRDELDYSTVFVLNMCLGVVLYLLLFFTAPLIAYIFKNDTLVGVVRLIGLNLIITSFVVVQRAKLIIQVNFKDLARASLCGVIISGLISILCAYKGLGVYTIVVQSLLSNFITTICIWINVKWHISLQFSKERIKSLYQFAYKLILSRFINAVFNEVYSVVIGIFYSPAQLGLFNRAKSFEQLSSSNIANIVQRVSTPILCEDQFDYKRMQQTLLRFISYTALLVYPMLVGLFVLAKPLIVVLLTEKWIGAVWILQVLCPVGFCYIISTFHRNVFNATGRTDWALKSEIIRKVIAIGLIIVAIFGGFTVLVWSQLAIAILELVIDLYYTKKQIHLSIKLQLKVLIPIVFASLLMGFIVYFITNFITLDWVKLLLGIPSGIFIYGCLCYLFNILDFRKIVKQSILRIE